MSFKLEDLRSLQSMARAEAQVVLDAAQFADGEKWIDTGLRVDADVGLILGATGKIDLAPQQAGQFLVEPDGSGTSPGGPAGGSYRPGSLLGRIGEKGEIFVIGKRYEGKAPQEGKLYVYVVTGGIAPTGSYRVNLTSGYDIVPDTKRNLSPVTGRPPRTTPSRGGFDPGGTGFPGRGGTFPGGTGRQTPDTDDPRFRRDR
jgi:hypothetical protein